MANQHELHAQQSDMASAVRRHGGAADILTAVTEQATEDGGAARARSAEITERVQGLAVHTRACPGAPRVVLVHGAMDRGASFIKATRRLPQLEVVRYDRRGYGRSIDVPVARDLDVQVRDLHAVVGATPSIVIGHSLGGVLALMLAAQHPDVVLAVGAYEAPMPWMPWWPNGSAGGDAVRTREHDGDEAAAERFMRRIIGDEKWERLPSGTRRARRAEGAALMADLLGMRSGTAPYRFEDLQLPVVAGRSTTSDAHHRRAADTLAAEVEGAALFVIEGADHGAHFGDPAAFADFISTTVARAD